MDVSVETTFYRHHKHLVGGFHCQQVGCFCCVHGGICHGYWVLRGFGMANQGIDPIQTLHMDAKGYPGKPGGITELAQIIGRSVGVLHNKFSAAEERYEITDREADAIAGAIFEKTGSTAYIEAKCAVFGGIFVPLFADGIAADDDVLSSLLDAIRRLGDLARELTEARADGVITPDEFGAIELRARRLQGTIQHAVQVLKSQVCEREALGAAMKVVR
jgi:hypothetical protein